MNLQTFNKSSLSKSISVLALFLGFFSLEASAQNLSLDIRNQRYSGDTMFFDVYLRKTSGSNIYLGNSDFVLTYNHANFSSPTLNYVSGSTVLKNSGSTATTLYDANIATTIGTTGLNANKLVINVLQPTFSNQTEFNSRIAMIDSSSNTHRLGTFYVLGLVSPTATPNLQWVTSAGTITKVFTLASSTPWKSTRISSGNISFNNPTPGTEPSAQPTALSVTDKTDTTISLSWTRGDGAYVMVLARSGSAVGSNLPVDGLSYTADSTFSSGSAVGDSSVYVVYSSTGTSATIYGLSANTTYHFTGLEYNGSGGYNENYYLSSAATISATTNAAEPEVQASSFTFTAFDVNQLSISMNAGDGAYRIIIARADSAVNVTPTDATTYTASTVFGSGTEIGNDNFVVFAGSDTSGTVTGLDSTRVYYFAVFEYNGGAGKENYLATGPLEGNRSTLANEPTLSASADTTGSVSTTGMTISWTNGNGARHAVIVKESSAVDAYPADGYEYTANNSFGSSDSFGTGNFLVYDGTGNSVAITGLDPNTTYYYAVVTFNDSGEATNFKTSSPATGSQITLQDAPTVSASNLSITEVTTSSMKLKWTNGNGANRVVLARAVSAVNTSPDNGVAYSANAAFGSGALVGSDIYTVYNGSADSVVVSGLSQDTVYHFAVYEYNGSAGSQNYRTTSPATGYRNTKIEVELTVMLEGSFNGTDMNTTLNTDSLLPLSQPYSGAPWNYAGTESVGSIPNADVVDWVYVEVRRADSAAVADTGTIQDRAVGFLLKDGSIVATDGVSPLTFDPDTAGYGKFFVTVYHRNHVGVISASAMSFSSGDSAFTLDFTSAASQAYGTDALIVSGGKALLYAGNARPSDSVIGANDRSDAWDASKSLTTGYVITDVNLDGVVDAEDRSIIYNNTGQDTQIP